MVVNLEVSDVDVVYLLGLGDVFEIVYQGLVVRVRVPATVQEVLGEIIVVGYHEDFGGGGEVMLLVIVFEGLLTKIRIHSVSSLAFLFLLWAEFIEQILI